MATQVSGVSVRNLDMGTRVERATAALPATTTSAIFTVAGGRVLITSILGEVTTVIQTQTNNTSVVFSPTTGTAITLTAVDVSALEVGGKLSVSSTATIKANAGGILLGPPDLGFIVAIGSISLTTAATNTGSVRWSLSYIPYDLGATVVAA